jgi:2-methylaconitate isomerase
LPTGKVADELQVPGYGTFKVSMVDAANAAVFVRAADLGLSGTEMPDAIEADAALMKKLGAIRIAASVAMGIARTPEEAAKRSAVPFVGFVAPAHDACTLTGEALAGADVDLTGRVISNGQPHRALPLTVSLCMAVAARLEGSVVYEAARRAEDPDAAIRIAMPSGVLVVGATVRRKDGAWHAEQGAFYRTQRRMFEGMVLVRASRVPLLLAAPHGVKRAA